MFISTHYGNKCHINVEDFNDAFKLFFSQNEMIKHQTTLQ